MTIPIVDTRTCAEKHDDRIAELERRVAALEAMHTYHMSKPPTDTAVLDPAAITWYGNPPAVVSVALPPGVTTREAGWVDQYAAAVDGTD